MGVLGLLNLHLVALFHLAVNLLTELCKFVLQSSVRKGLTERFYFFPIQFSPPLHGARMGPGCARSCVRLHPGVVVAMRAAEAGRERLEMKALLSCSQWASGAWLAASAPCSTEWPHSK